jgi:hypothetical protein
MHVFMRAFMRVCSRVWVRMTRVPSDEVNVHGRVCASTVVDTLTHTHTYIHETHTRPPPPLLLLLLLLLLPTTGEGPPGGLRPPSH